MTGKDFQIIIDLLVNLRSDKSKINIIAKEIESNLKNINPNITIDSDQVKKGISEALDSFSQLETSAESLEKIMSGLSIDLDNDQAKKAMGEIEDMMKDIGNLDLSRLENALDNVSSDDLEIIRTSLTDAFSNFDTGTATKSMSGLADQFEQAKVEAEGLMNIQKSALAQMKMTGQGGTEAYKKLEEEFISTQKTLKEMNQIAGDLDNISDIPDKLKDLDDSSNSFLELATKFEALGNLGAKLSEFGDKGLEARNAMLSLAGQTGLTGTALDSMRGKAEQVFVEGVGESMSESIKAIGTAQQMLGNFLDDQGLVAFTKQASAIGEVFDKDVNEVIAKSRTFIAQYGLDGEKAGNLVAFAMQKGGTAMDDVLDTLDEYSQLAIKAGYSAEDFTGILTSGVQQGVRDTDKLADSIKETQIRLNAGDTAKAVSELTSPVTAQIQEIVKLGETGAITVKEMTQQSAEVLKNAYDSGTISSAVRDQFSVALSGTMAEDIGGELWTKIFSQKIDASSIEAQAKLAGEQIGNAIAPVSVFEQIQKRFEVLAVGASEALSPIISTAGDVLESVSGIAPALNLIGSVKLGDVKEKFSAISNVVSIAGSSTKDFVKGVLSNLIPSLASAGSAGAASGAMTATAWGAALGPI